MKYSMDPNFLAFIAMLWQTANDVDNNKVLEICFGKIII